MTKINDINNNQNKIDEQLNSKSNKIESILSEDYNLKKSYIIAETDWITGNTTPASARSAYSDRFLPNYLSFDNFLDFKLDRKFIPFLNFELITKKKDNYEFIGLAEYQSDNYEGDYIEIYGNGVTPIYKGTPYEINHIYTQSDLDAGKFDVDYTKRVYRAVITYTDGGFEWMVDGTLSSLIIKDYVSLSPEGNQNIDEWIIDYNPNYLSSKNYAKFLSLTNTSFQANAQKLEIRWLPFDPVPPSPPLEYEDITDFGEDSISRSFSSVDEENYLITQASKYKKIAGNWVYQGAGDFGIDSSVQPILTRGFNFLGYWLFWTTDTVSMIGVRDVFPVVPDGSYNKKELYNLPIDPFRTWTTITFKRNPSPHPLLTSSNNVLSSEQNKVLIKKFRTTDLEKDKYRLQYDGLLVFNVLADQQQTLQYPVYNDVYSKIISVPPDINDSYSPSESHSMTTLYYYRSDFIDVEYKIRISLINPYNFSNRNNYAI